MRLPFSDDTPTAPRSFHTAPTRARGLSRCAFARYVRSCHPVFIPFFARDVAVRRSDGVIRNACLEVPSSRSDRTRSVRVLVRKRRHLHGGCPLLRRRPLG